MPGPKDVLCINPWIYDFTAYDFWLKPLGLLYITALLQEYTDLRVSYIDCLDRQHPQLEMRLPTRNDGRGPFFKEEVQKPHILKDIPRKYSRYGIPVSVFLQELDKVFPPDLVLLTCMMTYWYPGVQAVVELIRKKFGSIPVILGGVYPTLMPIHAECESGADMIYEGPGERRLFSVVNEVLGDGTCPEERFASLDEMPRPAFGLLRDKSSLPVLTSRGCPHRCSFCASSLLFEGIEQRAPSSVVQEIENHVSDHSVKHIAFYDDALLMNKKNHIVPLLKKWIEKKIPLSFHTPNGLFVREIDVELALLFKRSGFESIFLSQESFDEELIESSCPKLSSTDLKKALDCLERAGYRREDINVYLMVGLPDQDTYSVMEGIVLVQKLGARPRLAQFSPIPGTGDWTRIVSKGFLNENSDPLLHNKTVFPYILGRISLGEFESLKELLIRKA